MHSPFYLTAHGISVPFWPLQAIEKKEKLTIAASKIDVYSQKEDFSCQARSPTLCRVSAGRLAGWALGAGRKDVSKSPRHRRAQRLVSMTFQLRVLPSPRSSGQTAMDSWCHQRTMLKLRACASAVPEFERSQIASLSSFSAEVATAFIDAFLALQLCLTSRISSQQFNAHTFLEQGTSFQVKRGMQRDQRVQDQ